MSTQANIWKFGLLNSVHIDLNPQSWELYDYLPKMKGFDDAFQGRGYQVIGELNGMAPLVQLEDKQVCLVFEMETIKLVPLAASLQNLTRFLDEAAVLWKDCPGDVTLTIKDGNLDYARALINAFGEANPQANTDVLEDTCFAGLNYGFPL